MATLKSWSVLVCGVFVSVLVHAQAQPQTIVLHAARLLDIENGTIFSPGEVLVQGERISEVGSKVSHPVKAETIDLGDVTLIPGLIDAHIHLFLHPGAEDLQTVEESVPQRTIAATLAAKTDLMAGFTAERDMGTEGAGSADSAVRDAINDGLVPGPRLRVSGNAIDILGGHEDANHFNPAQHVLSNATYANNAEQLVEAIRGTNQRRRRLHQDLRNRPRLAREREAVYAISVHRGATGRSRRRSRADGTARGRTRHRRTGGALRGASRSRFGRSRLSA